MAFILVILLFITMLYVYALQCSAGKDEPYWYYPNCMQTAFGGVRCYPYYYPNRFSYPIFPWYYQNRYYYPRR